ncbi:MAG: aminotransferase class I/II-fold pyridoxal phosphate-dependent enzyme [Cyclobacteriaceae bacterium]|nr:aminotransferase class I/II-fold pyridoxal phosphate-dependent enzyme [Cyclobacteriaceae bacterium]
MIIPVADRLKITSEYYFSVKLQEIRQMQDTGLDVINLAIGNPDMSPSDETIREMQDQVALPGQHGYQPYRGIPELRNAIAAWYHREYGVSLDSVAEILPLIGSKEGITHISMAFLNPGDQVLVPELGYPAYRAVSQMIGAEVIDYPMLEEQGWSPDFNALEKMDLQKVKIMWVNYPHMPTGAPAKKDLFQKILDFGRKHSILVCHDNPYSLILNQGKPLSLLSLPGARELAIELNSMSKSHNMAGWRVGWIAGGKDYIDAVLKVKSNVDSGMFKPIQLAAVRALSNPQAWHESRNQIYQKRRELVYAFLDKLGCRYTKDQVGMFVWATIPSHVTHSEKLTEYLLHKHHIFVAPGFIFGSKGSGYIRASLCIEEKTLKKVLQRIESVDLTNL